MRQVYRNDEAEPTCERQRPDSSERAATGGTSATRNLKFEMPDSKFRKPPTSNPNRYLFWPTYPSFDISQSELGNPEHRLTFSLATSPGTRFLLTSVTTHWSLATDLHQ